MNIKLVKNLEEGDCIALNSNFLLQITDDNRQLDRFSGKKYFIFNPNTNERFEVMPEIPKYILARVTYVIDEKDYIIFSSAKQINEKELEIIFYRYNINNGEYSVIHSIVAELAVIGKGIFIKVFVLTKDYCLFETINGLGDTENYEIVLKDVKNDKSLTVNNNMLNTKGIDKMIAISGNICAIKIGTEITGIININRFISDMALGLDNIYMDILDESNGQMYLPYMRKYGDYILYLRKDSESGNDEVVIYNYVNRVKKVRFSSNISEDFNINKLHLINGVPYYFVNEEDGFISIVNLDTQKVEAEFPENYTVEYVLEDMLVTSRYMDKKFIIGKDKSYVEVFKFPDMNHSVYKVNGIYGGCIEHMDDLLIFIK